MGTAATRYDEVRYPARFYPQASPDRLATLATLYGLQPPPVDGCRVLEMGCGEGGCVIPLAYYFPQSTFLGVDLASSAIERGNSLIQRLGLKNAQLKVQNLLEFPRDAGTFDYIMAHGVLSWVPEAVREQMLEICSRHLAPKGVAYISYNTLPGGYLRNYARDLMRFHTRHISDCENKTREARNVVDFVVAAIGGATMERELLKHELKPYHGNDSFLFHDLIADICEPIYFLDFMDAAGRCGLQFVSESVLAFNRTGHFPEHVKHQLEAVPDRLQREQYLDFIHGRRFRQTILCRAGHDLDLTVTPERMERLLMVSNLKPAIPNADLSEPGELEFKMGQRTAVRCGEPLPKAAFAVLGETFPGALRFSELREKASRRIGMEVSQLTLAQDAKLIQTLVSAFVNGAVDFHTHRFEWCRDVSEHPKASELARVQAESQSFVVSMDLTSFGVQDNGLLRNLIPLLDGSRDLDALALDVAGALGSSVPAANVRKALELLAANAILVA
jgi:methyltransferase-like protein/ubiquinone/menaquinone biosynthesis C-methylase UbiE